jgi:rhamnose utilization protein RhaD (predicted bifunctional aldolase and dehydrogenase)/NAD(P)-dependent dehydrogenase (short-subunit alcohol dehydrogenase family)
MQNQWSENKAAEFVRQYGPKWGDDLALRTYTSRLLGAEASLVLHGGGNTSVKTPYRNVFGECLPAIYVKASGYNMAVIEPEGHSGLDLDYLQKLQRLPDLPDEPMMNEFRTHLFDSRAATPSLETLAHAFLPPKYIDHTHADAILALTNQADGERIVRQALGGDVIILDYVKPGFQLAKAVADAFAANPGKRGMVLMRHGLLTWGETARQAYETTIELVTKAEEYLAAKALRPLVVESVTSDELAQARLVKVAPLLRGLLAQPAPNQDDPWRRVILLPLIGREVLAIVDSAQGKEIVLSPPLTSDHLIRTKPLAMWIDGLEYDDPAKLRAQLSQAIQAYSAEYEVYFNRHAARLPAGLVRFDSLPRVVLIPGLGALCAGKDVAAAKIVRDITAHTLTVKAQVAAMGTYAGMSEAELFDMEYHAFQHAKLGSEAGPPLARHVALVTGAAGAIGSAICQGLLEQGCHVAVTDLPGENLDNFCQELQATFPDRVLAVPLDVTDAASVARAFATVIQTWGGVDLVVVNAGLAHVSSLAEMNLESFRRLERVNVEGTLLVLAEAGRHFKLQGTGGDVVAVSTKNVFAPGAKFGAYSATKAAAHQLARIASLEMAEMGVRVNMVSPDAIFSHGGRRSGLWAEVGPDRMRARGLDEAGLEEYYRQRNLLRAKVTARHVANAVLFFATRQTPTTGATIPVDGGLPDSTPR